MAAKKSRSRRRQRIVNMMIPVVVLSVVFGAIYFLSMGGSVTLPAYLNRCIPLTGSLVYDSRPQLNITINGVRQTIRANIGVSGTCIRPIHTVTNSGTIYVETDENRTYTMGDFFLLWGYSFGKVFSIFNQKQIFAYSVDSNHNLTMTVTQLGHTFPEYRFQDYPFPRDADTKSNPILISIVYG